MRFIVEHEQEFEIKVMCRVLQVSASGYYAWRKRAPNQREQDNAGWVAAIRQAHEASRQTYGYRRVHATLKAQGRVVNRKRVARLMRVHGLAGYQRRRKRPITTQSNPNTAIMPNRLGRDFTANKPNHKWLADITDITTREGFIYLASVEDVFSRKIVGWALGERLDEPLVEQALTMALTRRQPSAGLLHHSDRGSQYTSVDYRRLLDKHHITVSMSRTGNCLDNAMKESFFATLKTECANHVFDTKTQARTAVFEYIEVFYNRQRLHSALGYCSPEQFEQAFYPFR